jgi:hypothetical protein
VPWDISCHGVFSAVRCLFSDVGYLVMGHFESGAFRAVGHDGRVTFGDETFSDGTFVEWVV